MKSLSQAQATEYPIWNIVVDFTLVSLSLSTSPLMFTYLRSPREGFFCNDQTIRYPLTPSTIDWNLVLWLAYGTAIPTIVVMELWLAWSDEARRRRVVLVAGRAVPEWMVQIVRRGLLFGFGMGCQDLLVNIGKLCVGRPRPQFMALCTPNVLCNASDPGAYIQGYECTGQKGIALYHICMSFPSGHSGIMFYSAVFAAFYIERSVRWPLRAFVLKTAVQVLMLGCAFYTAITRIQDHKHHREDVVAGTILGAGFGFYWVCQLLPVSAEEEKRKKAFETALALPGDSPSARE